MDNGVRTWNLKLPETTILNAMLRVYVLCAHVVLCYSC